MISFSKQLKLAAVALAFGFSGAYAATVGLPITIDESAAGGAPNVFVADQLSGQYDEVVTFQDATHFSTAAIFGAGQWFSNGNPLSTQLNGFGAAGYGIYAKFIGSGTYSTSGGVTTFNASSNAIEIYLDKNHDTDYNTGASAGAVPSFGDLVLASGAASLTDDVLLGSASLTLSAAGSSSSGLANGNFEILFGEFALTNPGGEAYFVAPRPFHMVLDLNGNFQSITPVSGTSVQISNSSANAFFTVPEPGSLALVGVSLLGLGFVGKRRKSS